MYLYSIVIRSDTKWSNLFINYFIYVQSYVSILDSVSTNDFDYINQKKKSEKLEQNI